MKTILYLLLALMLPSSISAETRIFGIVAPGDSLRLSLTGVSQESRVSISSHYEVSTSGFLKIPHLKGLIKAEGKTTSELAREIEAAYKKAKIFTRPTMRLQFLNGVGAHICGGCILLKLFKVSGQVRNPGSKPWRPGMTLLEAVSLAAPNEFGAMTRVKLTRNGKAHFYNIETKVSHQTLKVFPDDMIVVPLRAEHSE